MRINVYGEELTDEVEVIVKKATQPGGIERTFYGARFYLLSPESLHDTPEDDDRSAITLWVPWTRAKGYEFDVITRLCSRLSVATMEVASEVDA